MEENLFLQNCSGEDVISFKDTMFKLSKLRERVSIVFSKYQLGKQISHSLDSKNPLTDFVLEARRDNGDISHIYQKWFAEGIDCEMLKIGTKSWQKGKVKINLQVSLEFCPDEPENQQPESPLDDLRLIIEKNHN